MKGISTYVPNDVVKTFLSLVKIATFSLLTLSLVFAVKHFSDSSPFSSSVSATTSVSAANSSSISATTSVSAANSSSSPLPSQPQPPLLPAEAVVRTGIVDENGAMTVDFVVGEFDPGLIESVVNESVGSDDDSKRGNSTRAKIEKFKVCEESMREYIPCLDNVDAISRLNSTDRGENYERHCPEQGRGLDCLVPRPKGYKMKIPWPKSRDQVWFDNVPHTRLVEDKGGQNWIAREKDKFIFPGGGTQFIHGANKYLDQISEMIPDITFGQHVRVALDVGCGVASFGAFLFARNVTTLSIAPIDVHENQIQFALERGVSAMVGVFATHRLGYPSQAFDLIHCSRCRIKWTRDDGILLLEANRILRAGGYFVWAAQPVYKHEENLQEQWKEMEDLTSRMCWKLIKREGYIAMWQKPLNNSCYLNRDPGVRPPLCDTPDDPDNVWYVGLKACITRLPENGYGTNITTWPTRLHYPPGRLFTIKMDAYISRKDIYRADSKYWNDIVGGYVSVFHLKELNLRNVLDMRAGYGGCVLYKFISFLRISSFIFSIANGPFKFDGNLISCVAGDFAYDGRFAAALNDLGIDCWVMNVVPVSGANTLPVIYDRGLVGVVHDWCEPFDTYPRTYDFVNAAGLFSMEQKRCDISNIMLEIDRILRPGGRVYIRDTLSVIHELNELAEAMGWVAHLYDTGEGPHASWKLLKCEKSL